MEPVRVLIVDDEEDLVSTLAQRLSLRGFQAEGATSAAEALSRAGEVDFSVLILDMKMPGIDGLELMAKIKQKRPGLPVILFTGHGSLRDAERGVQAGAFDYLAKPIDIEQLAEKIQSAVAGKKGRQS